MALAVADGAMDPGGYVSRFRSRCESEMDDFLPNFSVNCPKDPRTFDFLGIDSINTISQSAINGGIISLHQLHDP